MDLLLYLIRKHEVDIHDIPLSLITEQYIAYLDDVDRIDIDLAGEFLVMASTLMELKSRMLAALTEQQTTDQSEPKKDSDSPRLIRGASWFVSCLSIKNTETPPRLLSIVNRTGRNATRCRPRGLMMKRPIGGRRYGRA